MKILDITTNGALDSHLSRTPAIGFLVRGACHLAMQSHVLIASRTRAGELMGRHRTTLHTGRLQHRVVPAPIGVIDRICDSDRAHGLDEEIAQVRQIFLDTREQWPDRPASDESAR